MEQYWDCLGSTSTVNQTEQCYQNYLSEDAVGNLHQQMTTAWSNQWDPNSMSSNPNSYDACIPSSDSFNAGLFFGGQCTDFLKTYTFCQSCYDDYEMGLYQDAMYDEANQTMLQDYWDASGMWDDAYDYYDAYDEQYDDEID